VYIGDVWICSGQSNMEMSVAQCNDAVQEIAAADFPRMRLLRIEHNASTVPLNDVGTGGWQICSPNTVKDFSAVAYFFGRRLHESLQIPIGLVQTAWGGTVAEAWTSKAGLSSLPEFADAVQKFDNDSTRRHSYEEQQKLYKKAQQDWIDTVDSLDIGSSQSKSWADPLMFTDDWAVTSVPGLWEGGNIGNYDGIVWYRRVVIVPDSSGSDSWILSLGMIDDIDVTWVNGVRVGGMDVYNQPREYPVPDGVIRPGMNVIAVRILDHHGGGGFWGAPETMFLKGSRSEKISLAGDWRYKLGIESGRVPPIPPEITGLENTPTVLYNAMIHPLVPYGIQGVIWYQGESNADRAYQYRRLFPALIRDWRNKWNEDFPFIFVQLANYRARDPEPGESDWAELREAQTMTLSVPNTGMAVAIDIGDALDIHPKNKQDVGKRLALNAMANIHGEAMMFSGPIYRSFRKENNKIRVFFKYAAGGLVAKNDSLVRGFAIAAEDRKFVWANAAIEGESVIVSSPLVSDPAAVRYAWADNPVCNLYSTAGLPVSPFRTDDWPGITWPK
jgi:sialate O-acetylesterase